MSEKSKAEEYVRNKFPELRELRFGCKVLLNNGGVAIITGKRFEGYWKVDWDGMVCTDTFILDKNIKEIIGFPITLNYWLMALGEAKKGLDTRMGLCTNRNKIYYLYEHRPYQKTLNFNLTTGQPATEVDWSNLCDILGI